MMSEPDRPFPARMTRHLSLTLLLFGMLAMAMPVHVSAKSKLKIKVRETTKGKAAIGLKASSQTKPTPVATKRQAPPTSNKAPKPEPTQDSDNAAHGVVEKEPAGHTKPKTETKPKGDAAKGDESKGDSAKGETQPREKPQATDKPAVEPKEKPAVEPKEKPAVEPKEKSAVEPKEKPVVPADRPPVPARESGDTPTHAPTDTAADGPFAHAILLNGGGSKRINYYSHVLYLRLMRQVLQELGQPDPKIDIFSADGDDPATDLAIVRHRRAPDHWLFSYLRESRFFPRMHEQINTSLREKKLWIAKRDVFKERIAALAKELDAADKANPAKPKAPVMLFVTDHGSRNRKKRHHRDNQISMWNESMSVAQFHKSIRPLRDRKLVFVMSQCFSGSFVWSVFRKPGRFGAPLGNRCGFMATLPNRYSYGCFPETRLKKQVGHAYRFILAMRNARTFNDAHKEVLLTDLTPDVPHRTSDGYLYALLQSDAKADGIKPHKLVDQILERFDGKSYPGMTEDQALLGAVAQRFGLPRPMNLKALRTIRKNISKKRQWLERVARMWRDVYVTARGHHLSRFYKGTPALKEQVYHLRERPSSFFRKLYFELKKKKQSGSLFGQIPTTTHQAIAAIREDVQSDACCEGGPRDEGEPSARVPLPGPAGVEKPSPRAANRDARRRRIDGYLRKLRRIYQRRQLQRKWNKRGDGISPKAKRPLSPEGLKRLQQLRREAFLRSRKHIRGLRPRRAKRRIRRGLGKRRARNRRTRVLRNRRARALRNRRTRGVPKPKVVWPAMRTVMGLRKGFGTYVYARPRLRQRLQMLYQKEQQMRKQVFWIKTRLAALKRMELLFYRIAGRQLLEHDKHPDFQSYREGVKRLIACENTPLNLDAAPHAPKKLPSLSFAGENLPLPSWFGISFRPVNRKDYPSLPSGAVEVETVYLNTPARRAGLVPGDIIVSVKDEQLREPFEIRERVMLSPSTTPTPMLVLRNNALTELKVQLHRLTRPPALKLQPILGRTVPNVSSARRLSDNETPAPTAKGLTLLFFWATWCGPCKVMLPDMRRWQVRYKRLRILTVSNEKPAVIRKWIDAHPTDLPFENLYDPGRKLFRQFRIQGTPTMFVMQDGKVVYRHVGFKGLKKLEAAIRKHHP